MLYKVFATAVDILFNQNSKSKYSPNGGIKEASNKLANISAQKQPFKIPEKMQKYAKKISDIIIHICDTF